MKRVIFDRVLMLAIFVLVPCAVYAQDDGMMSFSEEEAEGEEGASGKDGTTPFDGDEDEPSDAEGGGTSEADVLSALGHGREHDRRHGDGEVGAVMLAHGEDIEADLIGQPRFIDDVEESLLWRDAAA